jgi:hypothetical protein
LILAASKKEKTTVNEIVSKAIEKKLRYVKIDDEDTKEDN